MTANHKIKILAVVGSTASGKTALSIALAKKLGGEIISCDSMQVYRRMDVGTAKPTVEEMDGVVHHLLDFIEPDEPFSCAEYAAMAKEKIAEIAKLQARIDQLSLDDSREAQAQKRKLEEELAKLQKNLA